MWENLMAWFRDSETIFWARVQVVGGILFAVIPTLNIMPILDENLTPKQRWTLAAWIVFSGIVTEAARRYRADDV